VELYEAGDRPRQETRHWDEEGGRTRPGRSKEEAEDYRYFPDPDLVPIEPDPQWVEEIRAALPALPRDRRQALVDQGALAAPAAIAVSRDLDGLALDAIAAGADAERVLTHVANNLAVDGAADLDPAAFAALVTMETGGDLTATQAKQVLAEMVESGSDPASIAAARGFEAMDNSELESALDRVIADNNDEWQKLLAGDDKLRGKLQGFFTGLVMKATRGQADGKLVAQLLARRIADGE